MAADVLPVIGVDIDDEVVRQINAGDAPLPEPDLQESIDEAGDDLRATTGFEGTVRETDISFVIVDTPSTADGRYSLEYIEEVCKSLGPEIAAMDDFHTVVITSTVFPGSTTGRIKSWLEEYSGKQAGEDFGLCYSPEFIAIGNVIEDLKDPDFYLLGEHSERAGEVLSEIYRGWGDENTPIERMDPITAEVTKMAVNSYVTTKISFSNTLAQICDNIGADVDTVTGALAQDHRIGGDYLTAGARYGGPCFPRDNVAFSRLADDSGTEAPIAQSTDAVNDRHTEWIAELVRRYTPGGGTVAILGMSYKPGTYISVESQGTELAKTLKGEFGITCHDPEAIPDDKAMMNGEVKFVESLEGALSGADTAVIGTQWDVYKELENFAGHEVTIVDPWGLFERSQMPDSVEYHPVGRPQDATTDVEAKRKTLE
jgi:UDPglucose 6-dehydrogenase